MHFHTLKHSRLQFSTQLTSLQSVCTTMWILTENSPETCHCKLNNPSFLYLSTHLTIVYDIKNTLWYKSYYGRQEERMSYLHLVHLYTPPGFTFQLLCRYYFKHWLDINCHQLLKKSPLIKSQIENLFFENL